MPISKITYVAPVSDVNSRFNRVPQVAPYQSKPLWTLSCQRLFYCPNKNFRQWQKKIINKLHKKWGAVKNRLSTKERKCEDSWNLEVRKSYRLHHVHAEYYTEEVLQYPRVAETTQSPVSCQEQLYKTKNNYSRQQAWLLTDRPMLHCILNCKLLQYDYSLNSTWLDMTCYLANALWPRKIRWAQALSCRKTSRTC